MSADALEPSWQDEAPVTVPPFKRGDLFERPDGNHLRYYRVNAASEDGGVILLGTFLGCLLDTNTPAIAKALSK